MQKINKIKLFKVAQAHTGITVRDFAIKYDCSVQHIYQVLKGITKSQYIEDDLNSFIDESLQDLKIQLDSTRVAA